VIKGAHITFSLNLYGCIQLYIITGSINPGIRSRSFGDARICMKRSGFLLTSLLSKFFKKMGGMGIFSLNIFFQLKNTLYITFDFL